MIQLEHDFITLKLAITLANASGPDSHQFLHLQFIPCRLGGRLESVETPSYFPAGADQRLPQPVYRSWVKAFQSAAVRPEG